MIEKGKKYKLIYASDIDFDSNIKSIQKIKDEFVDIEIPFLYDFLDQENRDNFNSYIYVEESKFYDVFNSLIRNYMDITFTDLGVVNGNDIFKLIIDCKSIIKEKVFVGKTYKVLSGEYKGIHIVIEKIKKDKVVGVFEVLDKKRKIELDISNVGDVDKIFYLNENDKFKNYVKIAKDEGNRKAIIVDGNYVLHRSMLEYKYIYQKDKNMAVGGAFGFYFTLLSLKELFCEYEVFIIFGGKTFKNDEYKNIWKFNISWIKKFVKSLGFYVINTDKNVCEVTLKIIQDVKDTYKKIVMYSNEVRLYNLISENVKLYKSKETSRGYSVLLNIKKVCDFFEVNSKNKINWAVALRGCNKNEKIVSINQFYDNKKNFIGRLRKYELLSILNKSESKEEFIKEVAKNKKYKEFMKSQFKKNLNSLQIKKIANIKIQKNEFNLIKMIKLLEEIGFNKEKEYINKVNRIFRGVW